MKFIIYNLQFTIIFLLFYILHSTFYISPAYAQSLSLSGVAIGQEYAFGWITNLGQGVNLLVVPAFSIATLSVVIYFLIGAFKWLSSGGDKEALEGARRMITHSIIGFIILMFAFLILQFLLSGLFGITGLKIIQ